MITLKKLAEQLNVSVSTVSKALNDSSEISQETIIRVKELAKHYNYQPNRIAQSLQKSSTRTIGVIIPNILNRFFAKVLVGIEKEANTLGYNIITCITNETLSKEKESLKLLSNGSVDGFILAASEETQVSKNFDHISLLQSSDLPVVMFDRVIDNVNCDKVVIDDFSALQKATVHLIAKGRKNIAFISNIDDLNVGKSRKQAYKDSILKKYHKVDESLILTIPRKVNSQDRIKAFFKANPHIDGVVSADNTSGTIVLNVAKDLGFKIPEDLSIIGFADEAISNLSVPRLSYISQNAKQIGIAAINLLVDRLNSEEEKKEFTTRVIPYKIKNQESL
ncbi:MAG: LacI family DNA-binding transcriptional regulator [Flavobacteriaceae bacterium]|nr:LacI family transcriptional regulator [Bacteroidia bacterium]NNL15611.1 LacI family DNA-binding transcriptional regulator [Flavobacteriaceae bacterium]